MNNANENLLPEHQNVQTPEQQIVPTLDQGSILMGIINIFDDNEIMPFKLYENVKSRHLPEEELCNKFSHSIDYLLSCFSLTGSLANLTRFSYLAYAFNGCTFLVQFFILVLLIGVPWCFMETALGQYSGRGSTALGDMVPIGKGVAVAMGYICLLNVICYSPIQSRCLLYMYWSISEQELPWKSCSFANNTECIDDMRYLNNNTVSKSVGIELRETAENFYLRKVLNKHKILLHGGVGEFHVPLLYCLTISWIVNLILLVASDKLMKYVRIFGSLAPFTFLFSVLAIIMMDTNAWGGFHNLFDTSKINFLDFQSWRRAAEQVLYSLDVGTGHLIIHGQNCNFRNNILRDILVVTLLNIVCAVASSMVIFGTANIIACKLHIKINSVFISGPGMFFVAVSRIVAHLTYPRILSFLAFFVLFVICILTQLSFLNPVMYLMNEYFKPYNLRRYHSCAIILCFTMFGLSLVTVTQGGDMLVSLLDDICSTMGILVITTFEAILIFGIYGINEFCADLTIMMDHPPSITLKLLFIGGPIFTIIIMLACSFYWVSPRFENVRHPPSIYLVAWTMAMLTLFIIIVTAVHTIVKFTVRKNFYGSFQPTDRWVPDLVHSLRNNELECMTKIREKVLYDTENRLIFGIGKPRLSIKIDEGTQTNETDDDLQLEYSISSQRIQHFYFEVFNTSCKKFELQRKHNENEVIAWDDIVYIENKFDSGVLEKYVQTE